MGQKVFGARPHPDPPFAAPALASVLGDGGTLDVPGVTDGDRHVLFSDQVLDAELAGVVHDLGAPLVAVLRLHRPQFRHHDPHEQSLAPEDLAQSLNHEQQLSQLVQHLLALESCKPLQLHVENRLRLNLAQLETLHQAGSCLGGIPDATDEGDDGIEVIERDLQSFEDVRARLRLAELELGPSPHHVMPERDELLDHVEQREHPWATAGDGQHDHAEGGL